MALGGCASIGPPEAPSLELPKPPTDLRAVRKADKVTLTWTIPARTTERQSVKYLGKTEICRTITGPLKQCGTEVGSAAPPTDYEKARKSGKKLPANFVDTLPLSLQQENPQAFATYAVEVLNEAGRGAGVSNQVRIPLVPTLPPFGGFTAEVTPQGILISWKCPATPESGARGVQYLFRIYRLPDDSPASTSVSKIADVPATDCVEGSRAQQPAESSEMQQQIQDSFLDKTFEWEKTYSYRATLVSTIEIAGKPSIEVEGSDTPEVNLFAHDVFPPTVPTGLQAVFSGPGQTPFIDLVWTPVTDPDLAGYNVYRSEAGQQPMKLNTVLVRTPAFRDANITVGKTYYYSVSAVDERGNESARSEAATETAAP
jgi:hypothetical protein